MSDVEYYKIIDGELHVKCYRCDEWLNIWTWSEGDPLPGPREFSCNECLSPKEYCDAFGGPEVRMTICDCGMGKDETCQCDCDGWSKFGDGWEAVGNHCKCDCKVCGESK